MLIICCLVTFQFCAENFSDCPASRLCKVYGHIFYSEFTFTLYKDLFYFRLKTHFTVNEFREN